VTLLLDTHAFLWFCQDDPLLSATAKALIEDARKRRLRWSTPQEGSARPCRQWCWEVRSLPPLLSRIRREPARPYFICDGATPLGADAVAPLGERAERVRPLAGLLAW
jgi:hypothetical protein